MTLGKMTVGDVQDLTYKVEYLSENLKAIYKNAPNAELLLVKFQQMNAELQNNVEFGIKGLKASLKSIDYDRINDDIVEAIKRRTLNMHATLDAIKRQSKDLESAIAKNKVLLEDTTAIVAEAEEKMSALASEAGNLALINKQIVIAASTVSFVVGIACMYALSFITWLPKPYFATPEQAVLLQMIKEGSLVLDYDIGGTVMSIHIDQEASNNSNKTTTGE